MPFAIAKKVNMTQVFMKDGKVIPVTAVYVPENEVKLIRTQEKDGYQAIQVGFEKRRAEFAPDDNAEYKPGQKISVKDFVPGQFVDITGLSRGIGFAGFIKRHGFHGMPASHGHDRQRIPGSIGQMFPQHVRKGLRMAGRMGSAQTTEKDLLIVGVDEEKSIILVKGSVPGSRESYLRVHTTGKSREPLEIFSFENVKQEKRQNAAE